MRLGWLLLAGCGAAARPAPAPVAPAAADVGGAWLGSRVAEAADGVRRVEVEHWQLAQRGAEIEGSYLRVITFLSTRGEPFACNQGLSYRLIGRYRVAGRVDGYRLRLRELASEAEPSPCAVDALALTEYEGQLRGGEIALRWAEGSRALARTTAPPPAPRAPAAAGVWEWRSRVERAGEVRIEAERWQLAEDQDGALSGGYMRTVTVYHEDGAIQACSGAPSYTLRGRYAVRGRRAGSAIELAEVEVTSEPSPCDPPGGRPFESGVGRLYMDELVVTWPG